MSVEEVWKFLLAEEGLDIWLGKVKNIKWEIGEKYKTDNGIEGVIRVITPLSHIRMTWRKPEWKSSSSLQLRTIKSNDKTTISFHHDRLAGVKQRKEMLAHWGAVLDKLSEKINLL